MAQTETSRIPQPVRRAAPPKLFLQEHEAVGLYLILQQHEAEGLHFIPLTITGGAGLGARPDELNEVLDDCVGRAG